MDKCNVLIVDGSPENLLSLTSMLKGLDINIISASSSNEALILLMQYDFALVLLDVEMPDKNGFEVAELIRSRKKNRTVPIILITTNSKNHQYIVKGYESGAIDYIFKPIEQPLIVFHKVKAFCELYEARKKAHETGSFLSQNKKQWQLTFDTMEDLTTIHDTDFRMLQVNRAMARFFDKEPEELVGRKCFEFFCKNSRECNNCPIISLKQDLQPHKAEINHPTLKKTFFGFSLSNF